MNYDDLSKEDLIYTLLRSEKSLYKDNYEKYISNNTTDELRSRINIIRMLLARLGDIITKKDRDKIRKKLHEIENKQKLTKTQKEKYLNYLIELVNFLDKKEKYIHKDYDDKNYTGIRNIENLFISTDDYYEPVLVKSSFNGNYEYYEIRGDKDKKLSARQYLYMISPELTKLINKRKNNNSNEQKVQLSMDINFMDINDKEKSHTFHVKSDNAEITQATDTSDVINELIDSFFPQYQREEQVLRAGSDYIFDSVDILRIHFPNIRLRRGRSYIKSPGWISSKKATTNPNNTQDNKCFQYAITFALTHQEISSHPERISKIKPHVDKYNWKDINFPAKIDEYKKFERSNSDIALNIFYAPHNEKKISLVYKSKYNRKQI